VGAAPEAPKPPAPFASEAELTGKPVAEVVVEGTLTVDPDQVRRVMATRAGLPFHPATYREDFNRVYGLGLFDNVILGRPALTPAGVRAVVRVKERPIVDAVELRGNKQITSDELMDAARGVKSKAKAKEGWKPNPVLSDGGRYDPFLANQMERAFRDHYTEKRYALAGITSRAEPVTGRPGHVIAVFEISEDRPVIITRVVLRGRSALPEGTLLKVIQGRPAGWFSPVKGYDPDVARFDAMRIQEVYRNSGYSDARVTALAPEIAAPAGWRKRRQTTVTFDIREGRLYRYGPVTFPRLETVSDDEVRQRAGLKVGASEERLVRAARDLKLLREAELRNVAGLRLGFPYSDDEVYRAARRVEALLGEYGRPFARADARREDTAEPGVAGVRFLVEAGPEATVGEVRIKGNAFTRDRVIRKELELFPGDIYDSAKVARSERNLRRRGLFEKVSIRPEPSDEPDVADLEVEVKEHETGMFNFGVYYSPDTNALGGNFAVTQRNFDWRSPPRSWDEAPGFRGGGQSLSLRAALTLDLSSQNYSIDFVDPWIWDTPERYSFGFGIFHSLTEYEDFETRRTGGRVRLGRMLFDPRLRGYVQYKAQNVYTNGVDDNAPQVLKDEEGWTVFSSGEVGLSFDTLDNLANPTKGVLFQASEEVFGGLFLGDHDIRKTELEGNVFLPLFRTRSLFWSEEDKVSPQWALGWPHVLHLRVLSDWAHPFGRNDIVPPTERFFAGGIGTVRGYAARVITPRIGNFAVGGDYMLVENVEYLYPIYQDYLRGVFFFDAGNVWTGDDDFAIHDQRLSYGGGLLIRVPAALGPKPIKLYFSKAVNPRRDEDTQVFQMSFEFLF